MAAWRSYKVRLLNLTAITLQCGNCAVTTGIWTTRPPQLIGPHAEGVWGSESDCFPLSGTKGWVRYYDRSDETSHVYVQWYNPVIGNNSYLYSAPKYDVSCRDSGGKNAEVVVELLQKYPAPDRERECKHHFQTCGTFDGDLVLLVGRTGAGKSSVINMLKRENVQRVGAVASTTRQVEGVPFKLNDKHISLVDTPGIGEAFTDADYHNGILEWYRSNERKVGCVVLVLQADARAHADDKRLVDALCGIADKPLLIVLNQVDKVTPMRVPLVDDCWAILQQKATEKSKNISEKVKVIREQFQGLGKTFAVTPIAADPTCIFNREELVRALMDNLYKTAVSDPEQLYKIRPSCPVCTFSEGWDGHHCQKCKYTAR